VNNLPAEIDLAKTLEWLEDKIYVEDGRRGTQIVIRFEVYCDPDAELPELLELVRLGRKFEEIERSEDDR
jgi:hypothetical protein